MDRCPKLGEDSERGVGRLGKVFNNSALCHCSETTEMSTTIADRQDNGLCFFIFCARVMLDRYDLDYIF